MSELKQPLISDEESGQQQTLKESTKPREVVARIVRRNSLLLNVLACCIPLLLVFVIPIPDAVAPNKKDLSPKRGWYSLGVFLSVILGFLMRPYAEGFCVLLGVAAMGLIMAFTPEKLDGSGGAGVDEVLSGFVNKAAWLVLVALFVASAITDTGLGRRLALVLMTVFGRSLLGIAYGICLTELILGPAVPSNLARGGGIIAPVVVSLCAELQSLPNSMPIANGGAFLILVANAANLLSSSMFLTASTSNAVIVGQAKQLLGMELTWGYWALSGVVPGLACMAVVPIVALMLARPSSGNSVDVREKARRDLAAMGPLSRDERVLVSVLVIIVFVWGSEGYLHSLDSVVAALLGLVVLIISGVLTYDKILNDSKAWNFLIWMGGLLSMTSVMTKYGVTNFMSNLVQTGVKGTQEGTFQILLLSLLYFLSMYMMSSLTAHAAAISPVLLQMESVLSRHQPMLSLIMHFTTLSAVTTHYGSGTAQIYYKKGYLSLGRWLLSGAVFGLLFLGVFWTVGWLWWCSVLGWCAAE